ncbi:MAG: hypothetical protein ACP6IP_10485 [Candidatus Njordarchaeia archaeon]
MSVVKQALDIYLREGEKALDNFLLNLSKIEKRKLFKKLNAKTLAEARQIIVDVVHTYLMG